MDPDTEMDTDWPPYFRRYKSGRVERLIGTSVVSASADPATGVTSKDVTIDAQTGISARLYLPNPPPQSNKKIPVLVYYHGGGFCVESAFSPTYQPFLNSLASKADLLVVSVNYRLAPEHKLPAAYDDSWAALKWVFSPRADPWIAEHGDLDSVFLAGDSAGGNISHQMAMRAGESHDEGIKIEGIVLIHSYFWGSEPLESETRDPIVRAWLDGLWKLVSSPGMENLDDPRSNPIAEGAPSLAGLGCKRVMVCVAEEDPMAERGRAYYTALKGSKLWGADDDVELFESQGEGHVFHLDQPESEKASEIIERVAAFLQKRHDVAS